MGIIIRQGLKNSVVTYAGTAVGVLNVLVIYNKFLTQEQFGLYASAMVSFTTVFASFAQIGLPHITTRYFNRFCNDDTRHNGFLGFLLVTPLIGLFIFTILYLSLQGVFNSIYESKSPLLIQYYYYMLPLTFCIAYISVLESYSKVHLRIVVPAIIRELGLRLSNGALVIAFGLGYISFEQLIAITIFTYVLGIVALLLYIKLLGKLYLTIDWQIYKNPLFKEMYQYGLWVLLAGASFTLIQHVEKIMLPAYDGGLNTTAIFDIASRIALVIAIPRNAIASISLPLLAESWQKNDIAHIEELYKKSSLILFIVGAFLFLGIWCNVDEIFELLPKADIYSQGRWVVFFFGLSKVIDMATGLNSEILINSKYYRYDLAFYVLLAILIVITNLILIPIYSFNGAALAALTSVVVYNGTKFLFIKIKLNLQPFTWDTVKVLALFLGTYFLVLLVPRIGTGFVGNVTTIVIRSVIICVIFGGGVLYFNISDDATKTVKSILRKLRIMKK
jgi:O-antigen/teichoic acid export membrane protein